MKHAVVVPWHRTDVRDEWLNNWVFWGDIPDWVILEQDPGWKSCARTKNAGIERAIKAGAEMIVVMDSDCHPHNKQTLIDFVEAHRKALEPQMVEMFKPVTFPSSRGTPYFERSIQMPVAASMGFWTGVPDFDAVFQLAMTKIETFRNVPIFGQYFPLCGMNLAFKAKEWPWCKFIDVDRFDDIWMGWLWQRHAYANGQCFNLNGPLVYHSRQSNVWSNLRIEAQHLERNETLWRDIATGPLYDYELMLAQHGLVKP